MIDRLLDTMRLASFRTYLADTVCAMSAIVPDVLALAGSDVGTALQSVRPAHQWPSNTMPRNAPSQRITSKYCGMRASASKSANGSSGHGQHRQLVGDAIISDGSSGAWVEAAVLGNSLEIVLRSNGYVLSTHAGTAHLNLKQPLPNTVITACEGRPINELVDHPLFQSADFIIERAATVAGASKLAFTVGQVGLVMPWRA